MVEGVNVPQWTGALYGRYAVIGGNLGSTSTEALVFDIFSGEVVHRLTDPDGERGFGASVAVNDSLVVVGNPWGGVGGNVSVFDLSSGDLVSQLLPPDEFDRAFGFSVAIDNSNAIAVGAPTGSLGTAYVYSSPLDGEPIELVRQGREVGRLELFFGTTVDIAGGKVVVGRDATVIRGPTSAFLFDAITGDQLFEIEPQFPPSSSFGVSVAIDGNRLIVGEPQRATVSEYNADTGVLENSWFAVELDIPPNLLFRNDFGASVDVNGEAVVAGIPGFNGGQPPGGLAVIILRVPEPTSMLIVLASLSVISFRRMRL
ncbi:MAG: hypothetical protein AAF266_11425 [Planctomycetota bacterium]